MYSSPIDKFEKEFHFLSNFHPSPIKVVFDGIEYTFATGEHLFQAAKYFYSDWNPENLLEWLRKLVSNPNPNKAKYYGRSIKKLRKEEWDKMSFIIMTRVQELKFAQNSELARKLDLTGNRALVEGNNWNDKLWGMSHGEGRNLLGKILMERRRLNRYEYDA